jgi:hypothetical protein
MDKATFNKSTLRGIVTSAAIGIQLIPSAATAVPISSQFEAIAIYTDLKGAFGLAYDSNRDLMWTSETTPNGGDGQIHPFKPYKNFTDAERAGFFDPTLGIQIITPTEAEEDDPDITPSGASALGYDSALDLLVTHDQDNSRLVAGTPITLATTVLDYRSGSGDSDRLVDGLDIDGSNTWFSPDIDNIYLNGNLFADKSNPLQGLLPTWNGLGSADTIGWSGVEQVGSSVFAVAVQAFGNVGLTRTLVEFDLSGNLVAYDPDGDARASRWEDLACDGSFLYATDTVGDIDGNGINGDVYVLRGTPCSPLAAAPEPSSLLLLMPCTLAIAAIRRRKRIIAGLR